MDLVVVLIAGQQESMEMCIASPCYFFFFLLSIFLKNGVLRVLAFARLRFPTLIIQGVGNG